MKSYFIISILFFTLNTYAQNVGEWTWMGGDSIANFKGDFGQKGVAAPTNKPPALYEACSWTDTSGIFWMFGGVLGYFPPKWRRTYHLG